ncbi:asparaginase [Ornithinicoccus halotolerans]|uniref:asparaginase n=1 Tax=Ornithinicoccus halotolerans TaxID=1748220 RepID=UPI001295AA29|nr:asparaginase [Ornithinicoccus halotolerans]
MTSEQLPYASAPVVARVERSGFTESVHHGVVAATDPQGELLLARGDVEAPFFPRSSNKPLQALAMVRHGLDLPDELLALVCASHSGLRFHRDGVLQILRDAGLTEAALQNTPDRPLDDQEARRWDAEGYGPVSLAQNCSGKHAGMLATCVAAGWDPAGYRDAAHPLQRAVAATIEELAGERVAATGVDGCGAPVMAVSPVGLARAFGRLAAAPEGSPEHRVAQAIRRHPEWLGGPGRDVTALITGVPGLIAKDGAEAVYAVGLPDGRGLAVKITDGGRRASPVVTAAALRALGVGAPDALASLSHAPVLGHGEPVGAVVAVGL